jgi:hypothetical protein
MLHPHRILLTEMLLVVSVLQFAGCGLTRSTDTVRTATEQLLISDAIDRAVQSLDLQALSGRTVYLDDSKLGTAVDKDYYISTLRQHLLASGCELHDKREEAEFIVEARAGAIGTDRNDLLFGLPATTVPQIPLVQPAPAAIPEIPIAKRKDQRGVAKIAVFAYHRATGTPVWQSGIVRQESSANDVWILGAGPFQRGTIYEGTAFAGNAIKNDPMKDGATPHNAAAVSLSSESLFTSPQKFAKQMPPASEPKAVQATHNEPVAAATPATAKPAAAPAVAAVAPPGSQTAAQTPATSPTPSPQPSPVDSKPAKTAVAPAGLSANTNMPDDKVLKSAYIRVGDANPLPQPRFNSPQ